MTTFTFPGPGPEELPPDDDLKLLHVQPASISEPDDVRRSVLQLTFNRPLTWWEKEAAANHRITFDEAVSSYVTRRDLIEPDNLSWANNLGRQIEQEARRERKIVADRAWLQQQEAEIINSMLARNTGQR